MLCRIDWFLKFDNKCTKIPLINLVIFEIMWSNKNIILKFSTDLGTWVRPEAIHQKVNLWDIFFFKCKLSKGNMCQGRIFIQGKHDIGLIPQFNPWFIVRANSNFNIFLNHYRFSTYSFEPECCILEIPKVGKQFQLSRLRGLLDPKWHLI